MNTDAVAEMAKEGSGGTTELDNFIFGGQYEKTAD